MSVVTFANPKGGTGKTTTCLLFSEAAAQMGYTVALLDCDPNLNLVGWAKKRREEDRGVPFHVESCRSEDEIIEVVERLSAKYDIVCLDMEGTASQLVTFALSQSDMCVIPFEPTPMETRQAGRALQLVKRTSKMIGREVKYRLVFTRTNAAFQTNDERDVRRSLPNVEILKTSIVRRSAYTRIFREADLLSELFDKKVANVDKAIQNANAFTKEIILELAEINNV
ncbi:ParA family protein [Yoonia vestfoldensis]|uniref:AAA domain protein n=1 Tax=Yoonia vestfoldensis TaxID=245188 RepID=A0A1Y0E7T4_9RHOB|nr:ParA family protein [Yoonia vestfoldensis]ART99478.1 AAA domain protein [Yoonia vestfoldensis]